MSTSSRANASATSGARGKSMPASDPPPAQRTRQPITPSATSRSNPLDHPRSSPSGAKDANATSSTNDAKPGVTRTTSASTTGSLKSGPRPPPAAAEAPKAAEPAKCPIDMATFDQILELDEPDDLERTFSKGIVDNYYEQVDTTFGDMDNAITAEDLTKLSALGHFLKGSSAALGIIKVQATCETMQHLGQRKEADGKVSLNKDEALDKIKDLMPKVREEYSEAKEWFDDFFSKPPA